MCRALGARLVGLCDKGRACAARSERATPTLMQKVALGWQGTY